MNMRKKYNTQELERRIEKIKKLILERNQIHEELSKLIDLNTDLESLTNQL
jgi:hypothetical protein